ncbi:MAG TPA: Hsp20/alpha crystallin family protein [Cyclobacteriaceae bacterium]|nr:Hsp20/alpha crystallin family protein [Cyclobacteriaceae bacterium]
MAIIKRDGDIFSRFPALFDDFFTRSFWDLSNSNFSETNTTIPAVNIIETDNNFEVEMAAPGMSKSNFNIELDNNVLMITSEKKSEKKENERDRFSRREFSYESFQRTFTLPKDVVDADKIQARYENGILRLTVPKKEEARTKPKRLTKIS